MSRFLNLEQPDPYRLFGIALRRSRLSNQVAYNNAFSANLRCNSLIEEDRSLGLWNVLDSVTPLSEELQPNFQRLSTISEHRRNIWAEAQCEDLVAESQASIVIQWADDTLRRFETDVLGRPPLISVGYGPTYGEGVKLTTLIRAATNAGRHVSDWDNDPGLTFPYSKSAVVGADARRAYRNIEILQRAFGIGKHEAIRGPVFWRVLVAIDGLLGTHEPKYDRVEEAIVSTTRHIARSSGVEALALLDDQLTRR